MATSSDTPPKAEVAIKEQSEIVHPQTGLAYPKTPAIPKDQLDEALKKHLKTNAYQQVQLAAAYLRHLLELKLAPLDALNAVIGKFKQWKNLNRPDQNVT